MRLSTPLLCLAATGASAFAPTSLPASASRTSTSLDATIAVIGATGAQGSGVAASLRDTGAFRVRALSRDAQRAAGIGDEAGAVDLDDQASLRAALEGV